MTPRSYLYVPGDREDLLVGSLDRGADAVVVDLEDSVLAQNKSLAREIAATWISGLANSPAAPQLWVRVNNRAGLIDQDLEAIAGLSTVSGISIPKVEDSAVLMLVRGRLGPDRAVVALIESAAGWLALREIASEGGAARLALGEADLGADLGLGSDITESELLPIRLQMVLVSSANNLDAPVGPAAIDYHNVDRLRLSTQALKRIGFGGRSAIHPSQVDVINQVFTPTSEEIEEAAAVVSSLEDATGSGSGVGVDNQGRMVDEAVARSAHRVLAVADRLGLRDD